MTATGTAMADEPERPAFMSTGLSLASATVAGVACGLSLLALGLAYERRRVSPVVVDDPGQN
jgi:hypothetical protein